MPALAQDATPQYPLPEDIETLDGIIKAYYEVVSGPAGEPRQVERDRSIHHPDALVGISGVDRDGNAFMQTMTLDEYHERSAAGGNPAFYEVEIHREVQTFGNVTHVWSTYAWSTEENGPVGGRGINSIQLYNDGERWWVMSWIFDSERSDNFIPSAFVTPTMTDQNSGTDVLFIAVSPVDENVVWASGTGGTYTRTTDGGATWETAIVPGADSLQFRDVHAVDANTAYLLSIGNGESSRIYKTTDAGKTWTLQFTNTEPNGFFDCMDFWDANNGIAFSDSIEGVFLLITTDDGGKTWNRVPAEALPPANEGEGSFAASGTCLVAAGDSTAWIGTGASTSARMLKTTDRGKTWAVYETPIVGGTSTSGIETLTFRDELHGTAMGGEIMEPEIYTNNVAVTSDGGETWALAGRPKLSGSIYGSAFVPGSTGPTLFAVGPKGIDYSLNNGDSWVSLDTRNHWGIAFASSRAGWAVGPDGRITKISF